MQAIWLRLDKKCLICQQRLHSMLALPPSVARTSTPCPHTSCIFRYSTAPTLGTAAAYTSWGQDARASKPLTHHRWTRRSSSGPQSRPDSSGRSGATRPRTAALSATAALKSSGTLTPLPARTNARTHTQTHTETHRHTDTQTHRHTDKHTDTNRYKSTVLDTGRRREGRVQRDARRECMRLRASKPRPPARLLHDPLAQNQPPLPR